MNVLMVAACPFPTAGGTQVLIGEMAAALSRQGTRVVLVTYGIGSGDLAAHDRAAEYTIERAQAVPGHRRLAAGPGWGRPVADLALTKRCLAAARQARAAGRGFDLVHAHNYEGAMVGAVVARALRIPMLYHAHNLMGDELETYFRGSAKRRAARWLGRALDRTVPRLADHCVSVSRHAQRRLSALTGGRTIEYQPPAVRYGDPSDAPVPSDLVYAGNMDGYQGLSVLDDALLQLPAVRCTVVSGTPWSGRADVNWVCDTGFEDLKAHLEGARLAVLPRTVPSGFPVKLVNYLCAGVPVVACRSGAQGLGIEEGVVVVEDGDSKAFAAAISGVLDDSGRRNLLARRARDAAAKFSWSAHVAQLERMYRDVVAGAGTHLATGHKPVPHRGFSEGVT